MVESDFSGTLKFMVDAQEAVNSGFKVWGKAWYERGQGGLRIHCEEPTCTYHFQGGCKNPEPIIEDDCFLSSSCVSYEPRMDRSEDIEIVD